MRAGIDQAWLDALAARGITTALLARLELKSGTTCLWTGSHPLTVVGDADTLLNNQTFDPISTGVMVAIGDNSYSYSGSDALSITLAIPATPSAQMAAAAVHSDEYQGRMAVIWRALMITPANASAPAQWRFRRARAGTMDQLAITNDGKAHHFTLTVEGHAALISKATGSNYLDQERFDSADTSQDFAVSIANSKRPS